MSEAESMNADFSNMLSGMDADKQERIVEILRNAPKTGVRDAYQQMAALDPVIWTMFNRRLAGKTMTFDMARHLRPEILALKRAEFTNGYLGDKEFKKHVDSTMRRHRPWQVEPLRDDHPHKAYKKARQVGISELSFTEAVCFLDQHDNTNLLYSFPRDQQLQTFATTRINPMFDETPRMRALLTGVNQVYTKRINQSHIILRSAWEGSLGEGVNADVVVLDEKDRMKPGVEVAFRESMSASAYGWLREVSTPSLPNRGVDESWLKSDMREWFVKCSRCGMKQNMDADSIKQMEDIPLDCKELPEGCYEYICKKAKCGGVLDRMYGEWVAKRPSVKLIRGYHMPQMIAIWISAVEIMQKRINYKWIQLWLNYVLGEVSLGESQLLNEHDFDMATAGHPLVLRRNDKWPLISAGIDWGHKNWVTINGLNTNGRQYILAAKMFEDNPREPLAGVRQIDEWLENYNPDLIVADDGYGKDRNAYLLKRWGDSRFFACRYNPAEKGGVTFTPRWSTATNQVLVDRTNHLKTMCRLFKDREIGFPNQENEMIRLMIAHMRALAPMMEESEDGKGDIVEVIKSTGDDHLAHAEGYAILAMDRLRTTNHFSFDF